MLYAGLDVSLSSISVCILDEMGSILLERNLSADLGELIACFGGIDPTAVTIGVESCSLSLRVIFALSDAGFRVVCINAQHVSAALAAMRRNKTDRNDARGIANVIRTGWYKTVHVKSVESLQAKALLTSRRAVKQKWLDLRFQLGSVLILFGVRLRKVTSQAIFERLVNDVLADNTSLAPIVSPILEATRALYESYRKLRDRVRLVARNDAICRTLMTVPGVAEVTALTYKAAIDDPARFRRSRDVGAYFGLTPRRRQSGEKDVLGHISKRGDRVVRSVLYIAAQALLTTSKASSRLKAWGLRLKQAKGHRIAVVAVSRKLAVVLHRMWVNGTEFDPGIESLA